MEKTKVNCPVCGAELEISVNAKVENRIAELKKAGIDIDMLYAYRGNKKKMAELIVGDVVVDKIMNEGTIPERRLFKQHVLAQVLKMITNKDYRKDCKHLMRDRNGYYDLSGHHGCSCEYEYSWKVLVDELCRQASMYQHGDMECYEQDNRWYNKQLALDMFDYHYDKLFELLRDMRTHKCKGESYIRYRFADKILRCKDSKQGYLYSKEIGRLAKQIVPYRIAIKDAKTPMQLYVAVKKFYDVMPRLYVSPNELSKPRRSFTESCPEFKNAYKGYGGYFAMQNLIRFHECRIMLDGKLLSKDKSEEQLDIWANEHTDEGYWMMGALKQLLRDNNFNIEAKQKEWREKYAK